MASPSSLVKFSVAAVAVVSLVACTGSKPPPAGVAGESAAAGGRKPASASAGGGAGQAVRPGGDGASVPVARGTVREVDMTTLFGLREAGKAVVYDVRPGFYHRMGHIPGAVSFPRMGFEQHFGEMKPGLDAAVAAGRTIVLYCTDSACPDGGVVAGRLAERGYPVAVYKGGWEEWKAAGLPVE